jgi:shikimate kinase
MTATTPGPIVLIGPPGAGKTSVGQSLAHRLGVPFLDTDHMVERSAGVPIAEIFINSGEEAFRTLERAAVKKALAPKDAVVALGGGAPMDPASHDAIRAATTFFLDVSQAEAAKRVGLSRARPLLLGNPRAQWRALMAQRRPTYQALAQGTVVTDGRSPSEIAGEIARLVHSEGKDSPR